MTLAITSEPRCVALADRFLLGEAPLWDGAAAMLYWIDIFGSKLAATDLDGSFRQWELPSRPGAIALAAGGRLLVALATGIHLFDPVDGTLVPVAHPEAALPNNRYNDCTVDAAGRLWIGSLDDTGVPGRGSLYVVTPGGWTRVLEQVGLSNGLGFSPDGSRLYHTDSTAGTISVYDVASDGCSLGRPSVFAVEREGIPDGLAVDVEGCVWSATFGAGRVVRYAPDGSVVGELRLPVPWITSVTFAGPQFGRLVVTSASIDADEAGMRAGAGHLFVFDGLGVRGLPPRVAASGGSV